MNDRPDDDVPDLHDLLTERARVDDDDLAPLRATIHALPRRRRRFVTIRGLLGAAAGIVVVLGLGGLVLLASYPWGTSGAAPQAPNPQAFAGDPRLTVCGVSTDAPAADAVAIFQLAHVRDYPLHLPAAYPLKGLQADPDGPALVIVRKGPASQGRDSASPGPDNHDLCMVVGTDPATWAPIAIVDVDTTGLIAILPEPTGTPFAADLAPWADRCGGADAHILAVVVLDHGSDVAGRIALDPSPSELATDLPAAVVVYDAGHPFPPLGTPPPGGATVAPREPLADGHHDLCVLVGPDPSTATQTIVEDVAVRFVTAVGSPAPSTAPSSALSMPAQIDPAECEKLSFAPDRCRAVVEQARTDLGLAWADIERVSLATIPHDISLGSFPVAAVTFTLRDGGSRERDVRCLGLGGQYSLVCTDRPEIPLYAPYGDSAGYHDVPCGAVPGGEPGSQCATPLPTIDPVAGAASMPLEVAARDIPIAATGYLEIDMGRATLPNGILSDARFSLADPFTRAFTVQQGIRLEVRSLDPSRPPFDNAYEHGWYPGTEGVEVWLVLDVTSVTPGAMLQVRDLVVR